MVPKQWFENLNTQIKDETSREILKNIFESMIELTIHNDWQGACHESCGAMHVLLNEMNITNTWYIGEACVERNGKIYFDHSWIEINEFNYDVAICRPLKDIGKFAPVIKGIDIANNQKTSVVYGVTSGRPLDDLTEIVLNTSLTKFLFNSPINEAIGTWYLIDQIARHKLAVNLDLKKIMLKYDKTCYSRK